MQLTVAVIQIYFYLQQELDCLFMKFVSFIRSLSQHKRKHPFNERKNNADQFVKKRKGVIFIENFCPLDFDYILAEIHSESS